MTVKASEFVNPFIEQRADPFMMKHHDGYYYFTASVPEYNRIELRRSKTIDGLRTATPVDVWHKHEAGDIKEFVIMYGRKKILKLKGIQIFI